MDFFSTFLNRKFIYQVNYDIPHFEKILSTNFGNDNFLFLNISSVSSNSIDFVIKKELPAIKISPERYIAHLKGNCTFSNGESNITIKVRPNYIFFFVLVLFAVVAFQAILAYSISTISISTLLFKLFISGGIITINYCIGKAFSDNLKENFEDSFLL